MSFFQSRRCARIRALLPGYLLDTLSRRIRLRVQTHIERCPACRKERDILRAKLDAVDAAPSPAPPQGLADRALFRVEEQTARGRIAFPAWRDGRFTFRPLAVAVPVFIIAFTLLLVVIPALPRAREAARRSSCQNNLKQIGLVLRMYANESKGNLYPPAVFLDGLYTFDLRYLYPEYLTDPAVLICPHHPEYEKHLETLFAALNREPPDFDTANRIAAENYAYTGYAIWNERQLHQVIDAWKQAGPGSAPGDIETQEGIVFRMREDIGRHFSPEDSISAIPVAFDQPANSGKVHVPGGINVLYGDGHTSFLRMHGEFPYSHHPIELQRSPVPAPAQ